MKFKMKNLGLLDEAEVELGDFTIFCGENNTGKTYAAYAIYGFLSHGTIVDFCISVTKDFESKFRVETNKISIKKDDLKEILEILPKKFEETYGKTILFNVLGGNKISFENSIFESDAGLANVDTLLFDEDENFTFFDWSDKKFTDSEKPNVTSCLIALFRHKLPFPHMLSVERTGVAMFNAELNLNKNAIVNQFVNIMNSMENGGKPKIPQTKIARYPLPVVNNLDIVNDLSFIDKHTSFLSENKSIKDRLWDIVGGKYIVDEFGNVAFAIGCKSRVMNKKSVVDLKIASSSVKSLMLLNFYILNSANEGDILMIDEPELNLHPKNQILLARLLVALVNAGVKVFVTTHSDYIVREVGNCVMAYALKNRNLLNDEMSQIYSDDICIDHKKIKVYEAKMHKKKNILASVKVDDDGIGIKSFNEAINSQNESQNELHNLQIWGR